MQEGVLSLELVLSDGTSVDLSTLDPRDYSLSVKTLTPSVAAVAPTPPFSPHSKWAPPRLIALGSGQGRVRVILGTAEECWGPGGGTGQGTLVVSHTEVDVAIKSQEVNYDFYWFFLSKSCLFDTEESAYNL